MQCALVRRWWRRSERRTSREERESQLREVRKLASHISEVLKAHGDSRSSDLYAALAEGAALLIRDGFTQQDLNDLSALSPAVPSWLDPRAADFDMHREEWQIGLGPVVADCRRSVIDLRVIQDL